MDIENYQCFIDAARQSCCEQHVRLPVTRPQLSLLITTLTDAAANLRKYARSVSSPDSHETAEELEYLSESFERFL